MKELEIYHRERIEDSGGQTREEQCRALGRFG